jgi:CheY-like chemotaxis protein
MGANEPVMLLSDPVRLTQVLINLLNNASRYSDEGGNIYIAWGREEDRSFVVVRDEGRGIATEAQQRIFDMFVQEREGGRGLGLGLTLVRQIVEMHDGTVSVRSDGLGTGSEFRVDLPSSDAPVPEEDSPGSYQQSELKNGVKLHIVLVEDDEDIRETMTALLEAWGHVVEVARDGVEGVELVTTIKPDVALVDIGLPRLDGHGAAIDICKRMGSERPALIALSGYGQQKDRNRSQKAGFDLHLVKPADPALLQKALLEVCQKKQWPAQPAPEKS